MTLLFLNLGAQEMILLSVISISFFIIPIIALVDILRSNFEGNNKLIWILVVLFTSIIGSILYFAMGRKQKIE